MLANLRSSIHNRIKAIMQPLSSTERGRLTTSGELAERIAFAKLIGNHQVDSFRFRQALLRTARFYLQSKGVPEEKIHRLVPLPAPPPGWRGMPTTGAVKAFALLIEFQDTPHTNEANTIQDALFGSPATGYPYESLANFYRRASYNKLDLSGGTTLGWYKTNKNRSQITQSDAGRDALIKEALQHFDAQGHNFKQYDNDNDGVIDYFMVFWTGADTGWGSFWWGYQTGFSDQSFTLDGVKLGKYSWQWESSPVGSAFDPRVTIHETGHALGLPDLYDYDGNVGPDGGVGGADMMDSNQFDHNCFSKWMLDWLDIPPPTIIGVGSRTVVLNPSGTSQDCVVIWPFLDNGDVFSEFFMVENRQPVGNDTGLPGSGLLIWHIDSSLDASGNNFAFNNSFTAHKLVRLMEADGREDIEANRRFNVGDFYTQGKSFGPNTAPSNARYDGRSSFVEVSSITPSGSQLSAFFKVIGIPPQKVVADFGYDAGGWRVEKHPRFLADLTGDGRADIVGFGDAGVWVALNKGDGTFQAPQKVVVNFGYDAGGWRVEKHPRFLADLTGDGRADIVGFGDAGVWVALNKGDGTFQAPQKVVANFGYDAGGWRVEKHPRFLADLTGDGRADIVGFGDAGVWVALNKGDGTFQAPQKVVANFGYDAGGWRVEKHPRFLADLTGDGRADIVGFGDAGVWVALNKGDGTFQAPQKVVANFGYDAGGWRVEKHPRFLADLTGDGRADIVGFGDAGVWVALNKGDGTFQAPQKVVANFGYDAGGWRVEKHPRFLADLTGDGRADIVGFGDAGVWVALNKGDGTFQAPQKVVANFGYDAGGWRVEKHPRFLADLTGDGRADIVGFGDAGVWIYGL